MILRAAHSYNNPQISTIFPHPHPDFRSTLIIGKNQSILTLCYLFTEYNDKTTFQLRWELREPTYSKNKRLDKRISANHACQLNNFSMRFMSAPAQNTTTISPASTCVPPETSMPSPFLTSPPKVTPLGSPNS